MSTPQRSDSVLSWFPSVFNRVPSLPPTQQGLPPGPLPLASGASSSTSSSSSSSAGSQTTPTPSLFNQRQQMPQAQVASAEDEESMLKRLKEANDSLASYGVPGFGQTSSSAPKRTSSRRARGPDLNATEKRIADWCKAARVPFHQPESEDDRADPSHPEHALNYIDTCTDQALREIQSVVEKEFPDLLKPLWHWILNYSAVEDIYPTHRAYLFAKYARITHDLDPKRKLKNRNRRAELLLSARRAEDAWISAMKKKMRAY